MGDEADMSGRYNTPLSEAEQKAYAKWIDEMTAKQGRDVSADMRDYDMQGFFKSGEAQAENGHFTDTFKKPNHPTFSTESKYHGKDGNEGGSWKDLGNGKWEFRPGATNLKHFSPEGLMHYLTRSDPDVRLAMPEGVQ